MLAAAGGPPAVADPFECHLIWMSDEPMLPGRPDLLRIGTQTVGATAAQPKCNVNVDALGFTEAERVENIRRIAEVAASPSLGKTVVSVSGGQ